jgi:2-polyprenyl-3-methyl-5-hydroxy-6-metoxy-1,4-benzoquinol methylase
VNRHGQKGLIVAREPAAFRAALHWCEANLARLRAGAAARARDLLACRSWTRTMPARAAILHQAMRELKAKPPATAKVSATEELKTSYRSHLQSVSGADEATWLAACEYYRAELGSVLPEDRSARIVEIGCGFGHLLRFLAGHGYRDLTGVDLDPELAAATRDRLRARAEVHCRDATTFLAAHPGEFDLVLAYDILEHFDLDGALQLARTARAALRPGGRAVFRTPNMANVLGAYSRWLDLTHRIGFTEQSAAQLLRAAGYSDVALVAPAHCGAHAERAAENRRWHEQLFRLQDRSMPTCFDKNLVVVAANGVTAARAADATAMARS